MGPTIKTNRLYIRQIVHGGDSGRRPTLPNRSRKVEGAR